MSKSKTSPRKFAEKIALLNKKEAEVTAEFVRIIKEVEETTRAPPVWQQNHHHSHQAQQATQSTARQQLPIRSSSVSDPNRVHYPRVSPFGESSNNGNPTSLAHATPFNSNAVQRLQQHQQQNSHNQFDTTQNGESSRTNSIEVPNITIFPTEDERYQSTSAYSTHHQSHHQPPPPAPAPSLTQCTGFGTGGSANNMLNFSYNQRDDCSIAYPITAARSMPNIANLGLSTSASNSASPPLHLQPIEYTQPLPPQQQHMTTVDNSNNTSNSSEFMCNYSTQQQQLQQPLMNEQLLERLRDEQNQDYCNYESRSPIAQLEPDTNQMMNGCNDANQSMYDDWQQQVLDSHPNQHQHQRPQTMRHQHFQSQQQVQHPPQTLSPSTGTELSRSGVDNYYHNPHLLESSTQPMIRANSASLLLDDWNGTKKSLEAPRINNYLSKSSEADCCGYLAGCQNNNSTSPCCSPQGDCGQNTRSHLTTSTSVVRSCSANSLKETGEASILDEQVVDSSTFDRQANVENSSPYQFYADQNCS